MRFVWFFVSGVVLLSFAASLYALPRLPDRIASHWNAAWEVDGYVPKTPGVFLVPLISAAIAVLFAVIPAVDPMKANFESFRRYYDGFVALMVLFMLGIHVQTLLWNLGFRVGFNFTMPVGLGVLFYYVGVLCEHSKRNWFVGIRTPWTMSSDRVWDRTHRVGGRLFKVSGLVAFAGVLAGEYAFYLIIVPVVLTAAYTTVYSYLEFRREARGL